MQRIEDLRGQIIAEERNANLDADGMVTPAEIHRRRRQIAFLAAVVLVGLLVTTVANDVWTELRDAAWIDAGAARIALIVFGLGFAAYVFEQEQHLKRLSHLSADVEALDVELAGGLLRAAAVAEAIEAVHDVLDLDDVAPRVVEQGCRLVGASHGSLRLVDADGVLRPAAATLDLAGGVEPIEPIEPSPEILAEAQRGGDPLLLRSGTVSMLCAPLVRDGCCLGMLVLGASGADGLGEADRVLIARFTPSVASAIEHARRYEAALYLLDEQELPEVRAPRGGQPV